VYLTFWYLNENSTQDIPFKHRIYHSKATAITRATTDPNPPTATLPAPLIKVGSTVGLGFTVGVAVQSAVTVFVFLTV
jgi:hypothetical protein